MKIKNFILPVLAFIFAIGISFAAAHHKVVPKLQAYDYILVNGSWEPIPEQDCGTGNSTCKVQLEPNGQPFPVYDEMNSPNPKPGDGSVRELY